MKKRALISVSDKTGVLEFAKGLIAKGYEIVSTGGTYDLLKSVGAINISDVTGFPEIMDGRVKTLHPAIHGGILAVRENPAHMEILAAHKINTIDIVACNLYPFKETIKNPNVTEEDAIENIDIGGPSMIRSAAKNCAYVAVVVDPADYEKILNEISAGEISAETKKNLAAKAFRHTAAYDALIAGHFTKEPYPEKLTLTYEIKQPLRYGENPHQKGLFYGEFEDMFEQLQGKEISYNNLLDIDAAVNLIADFDDITFAILKHNNACGVASRPNLVDAWKDALAGDPVSAFGGVLITNAVIDKETAKEINKLFFEVIIAPDYDLDALEILTQKKNRIILVQKRTKLPAKQIRSLLNGILVQDKDLKAETAEDFKVVTEKEPAAGEIEDLIFANKIVKHTKSNAIVLAKNRQLCASGMGQTSRIDALKQAIERAASFGMDLKNAVMASDAFFPFPDCVEIAKNAGISAVVQPGGSIKDQDSINYCNANEVAMVMTGFRHFKH
jgi:phosphoribosylaminoimidazolecarboxamide formyltransferase/IMP cyclohydrolase